MKKTTEPVLGVHAPTARPTIAGAFWLACVITCPVALAVGGWYVLAALF